MADLFKHIWNKVYFNRDLPKDRSDPCDLTLGKALFEFFVPTTKRKNSVSQWLGFYQSEDPEKQKQINSISDLNATAIFLIIIDVLLYIPRFALNIVKLFTEVLPLTLRELAYAAFESMVKGADETDGISKRLYQLAAGVWWLFTSLLSLVYLIGGLITSPGMTISSMMDTMEQLEFPGWVMLLILGLSCLAVFAFQLAMIVILSPIILPISVVMTPGALVIEGSQWIGTAIELALVFFGLSGLMFNNNPDHDSLIFKGRETSLSIYPTEFSRIADEKSYQNQLWERKIKKLGDKATAEQKALYKTQAESDPMVFLKICNANLSLFSTAELNELFDRHKLSDRFAASVQPPQKLELVKAEEQENFPIQSNIIAPIESVSSEGIELFKAVVGKIFYRLSKEQERQNEDNIDLAIEFVKLIPNWIFLSLKADFSNEDGSADFDDFISSYAQSDKLEALLRLSVCRANNNNWIVCYIAEKIWFTLIDQTLSKNEKQEILRDIQPFSSLLSDKDCSFIVKSDDLRRMYQSANNAILILNTLPRLFVHCGIQLVSSYFDNETFMDFLVDNYEKLNVSGMIDKICKKKNLNDKIKPGLTELYPYLSDEDKEKINKAFPEEDFSKRTSYSSKQTDYHSQSTYHSHDSLFTRDIWQDNKTEREQCTIRIKEAEQYANDGIDLYAVFGADLNASFGNVKSTINKFYRDNAERLNTKEAKETFEKLNSYKAILLCPHARPAYDNARNNLAFKIKRFFNT